MKDTLQVGATEQAQSQLQSLTGIIENILASARNRVIEGEMEEENFADLSGRIALLNGAITAHAQKHGDLTHLRVEIGQKPVGSVHNGIDPIVQELLDTERHRTGMNWQGHFKSNIEGLSLERRCGIAKDQITETTFATETFFLTGKAFFSQSLSQPVSATAQG
ncbi:MAG: hypothetical protein M1450_02995 [Patescibacteria group bacterium]|nr:hypothetical protein [Actinomycetota bacterium]MCL5970440.1 hypothetical protein [Patescibacteria group bacterium]